MKPRFFRPIKAQTRCTCVKNHSIKKNDDDFLFKNTKKIVESESVTSAVPLKPPQYNDQLSHIRRPDSKDPKK
jgi:hypothetical protein